MKIQLIGTGSIGSSEYSACTLIDNKLLIDMGNGNIKKLMQLGNDLFDIKAVLITHLHGDHFLDIPFFLITRRMKTDKIKQDVLIYGPKDLERRTKILLKMCSFSNIKTMKAKAQARFIGFKNLVNEKIDEYTVNSYLVDHGNIKPAYGYIVEKDGKRLGFSGDSIYCDSIDEIVKNSDVAILDMSKIEGHCNHMGIDNITMLCEKYPDKKIIATHMQDNTRQEAEKLEIDNLIIPKDGEIFEL